MDNFLGSIQTCPLWTLGCGEKFQPQMYCQKHAKGHFGTRLSMFSTFNLTQFRFVFSKLCIHIPIKFDLIKINDWLRPERRPVVQAEDCHPQTKHLGPREGTLQGAENVIYLGFAAEKVGLYHVFPRKNREIPPISPISASGISPYFTSKN